MQSSKLIKILQQLTDKELKAFDKFIRSPYFNNNKTIFQFWSYIRKYAPAFEHDGLEAKTVFKKLFPGKRINDLKLRQLRSALLKLLENFLVVEQLKQDEFQYEKQVADAYYELGFHETFLKKYHELLAIFHHPEFLSASQVFEKMSLHHQLYFNQVMIKKDIYPVDLAACTELLENYYAQQQLFYASEWYSLEKRFNFSIPLVSQSLASQLQQSTNLENVPDSLRSLVENINRLFLMEDVTAIPLYYKTKESLTNNYHKIRVIDKHRMLKLLINFCISQQTNGKNWEKETFELYKLGLTDNALFINNKMSVTSFMNIIYNACFFKEFEWVDQFILNAANKLPTENKSTYLILARGYLAFFKGDFQNCLELLSSIKLPNIATSELIRKSLQIRAAFECYLLDKNYSSILFAHLDSYHKFLSRKEILTKEKKLPYQNFSKGLSKLSKLIGKPSTVKEFEKLKQIIFSLNPIHEIGKAWLLSHIEKQIEAI